MRFLCLHGLGTNNQIFRMQTAALRYELGDNHEFDFVQGVVPWSMPLELESLSNPETPHFAYFDPASVTSQITALDDLDRYIAAQGPFDGVFAFSQGAGLAAMHIVRKTLANTLTEPPFRCAIFFAPTAVHDPRAWWESQTIRVMDAAVDGHVITIPSVVVWGQRDEWKHASEGVSRLCKPQTLSVFVHEGKHEVPGLGKDAVQPLAKLIKRCIFKTSRLR